MAGAKEIKTKIASVQSTQKITKAMEMVATSKMRKTQDRMAASRPYSETIRNVISHVSKASVGYKHPFLIQREVKKVGILVVSTDRGMCGGLNINLFKTVMTEIKQWKDKGVNVELGLIGSKICMILDLAEFWRMIWDLGKLCRRFRLFRKFSWKMRICLE